MGRSVGVLGPPAAAASPAVAEARRGTVMEPLLLESMPGPGVLVAGSGTDGELAGTFRAM